MEKIQILKQIDFFINSMEKSEDEIYLIITEELFSFIDSLEELSDNQYDKKIKHWSQKLSGIKSYSDFPKTTEELKELAYASHKLAIKGLEKAKYADSLFQESILSSTLKKFSIYHLRRALKDIVDSIKGKIFIIHGHDTTLLSDLTILFLQTGINHVILKNEIGCSKTIIEQLLDISEDINFAIALLTPDDKLKDGSLRARQNVILEIGFFLGKLGKDNIRLIVKDLIDIPSDLQGVLYLKYDQEGAWRYKLLNEINKSTNLNLDLAKVK